MTRVRIFFATNRDYLPGNKMAVFGGGFNPDGVAGLRFGRADFEVADNVAAMKRIYVYPDQKPENATELKPSKVGGGLLDDLRIAMKEGCNDTLLFIHGFNVSFTEALEAGAVLAAQISIDGKPINLVVFSWPSDGTAVPFMSYYSDREDARASGPAVARAYLKLFDFMTKLPPAEYCDRTLHLLAHSMGNYVLRNGLQAIRAKDPRKLVRIFGEIILAAPDEDDDAFDTDDKLRLLPSLGSRVTVYHNHLDRALFVSDKTKTNPDRLGSDGPRMLDLLPKKVIIVDCARVATAGDKHIQHSYFINCPPVTADLKATLQGESADTIGNRETIRPERAYRIR